MLSCIQRTLNGHSVPLSCLKNRTHAKKEVKRLHTEEDEATLDLVDQLVNHIPQPEIP